MESQATTLGLGDLATWDSLALAITCADLVGIMRGAVTLATEYARQRAEYGATIGSFQAVQHLLADAHVAMEGSRSIALHAAWAVDVLPAVEALVAASAAKAYCARAARSVCETAIQVHGGIGNTWECLAHVYLRRARSRPRSGGPTLARALARQAASEAAMECANPPSGGADPGWPQGGGGRRSQAAAAEPGQAGEDTAAWSPGGPTSRVAARPWPGQPRSAGTDCRASTT